MYMLTDRNARYRKLNGKRQIVFISITLDKRLNLVHWYINCLCVQATYKTDINKGLDIYSDA